MVKKKTLKKAKDKQLKKIIRELRTLKRAKRKIARTKFKKIKFAIRPTVRAKGTRRVEREQSSIITGETLSKLRKRMNRR
jgi:hypothetical protein